MIRSIRKRDGRIVGLEPEKIASAIGKAFWAVGKGQDEAADRLAERVEQLITYFIQMR